MNDKTNEEKKAKVLEPFKFTWVLPKCCELGLPSCKHVAKREKKSKRNVGL